MATLALLILALGVAAGCSQSDPEEAVTPEGSETIVNTAPQTNEQGETIPAPTDTGAAPGGQAPGGTETADGGAAPPEDGEGPEPAGDVAAGETLFAGACAGCHLNNGRDAGGVGPQLAGASITEQTARSTIENGRGAMPGGLASGEDLDNVVAYVQSLQ